MDERYFGKVVNIIDKFTVVMNKGAKDGVKANDKFLVITLGEIITDPDTGEELEKLEIVRGKVKVIHPQERISTLRSCEYEKSKDQKEIKKVTSRGGTGISMLFGGQDTVTESITPGEETLKELSSAQVGDLLIKL